MAATVEVVRKLVRVGPLRSAVKLPRAAWGNLPAVRELESKPLCLPGWSVSRLLLAAGRVDVRLER